MYFQTSTVVGMKVTLPMYVKYFFNAMFEEASKKGQLITIK